MVTETLQVTVLGGERGLRLAGELDMASAPLLLEALATMPGDGQARLDLSELVFIDSSGLHAIVQFARQEDGNAPVILEGASAILMTMFEVANISDDLNVEIRPAGADGR
jgi:anti-anti-sigma factor